MEDFDPYSEDFTAHFMEEPLSGDFTVLSSETPSEEKADLFSGDFTALSSDNRKHLAMSAAPFIGDREAIRQSKEKERDAAIRMLCDICGKHGDDNQAGDGIRGGTKPLRVVIIGRHGAGKSSFINSVAAALSEDRWREYAYTGYCGRGAPITIVNQRFEKCCNGQRPRYQNVHLPTLIDVAGLSDEADDKMEELLRLLFYGHIEEDEAVMKVYEDCRKSTRDEIRSQYSQSYPEMRVDRVVFVASAADPLPDRLMACVHRAARPSHHMDVRRSVPIYGVLTKMDKVDVDSSSFLDSKRQFMEDLGLNKARLLLCRNYCDDLDPEGQRTQRLDPDLDIPYIYFLQQLCEPALTVIREDEILPGSKGSAEEQQNAENAGRQACQGLSWCKQAWRDLNWLLRQCILSFVITLFVYLLVSYFGPNATTLCRDGTIDALLCRENSPWVAIKVMLYRLFAAVLGGLGFFFYKYFNRQ